MTHTIYSPCLLLHFFPRSFSWSKFIVSRDIWKLLIGQNTDKHPDCGYQLHISNASWLNTVDGLCIERINEQFSLNWDSQEVLSEVLAKKNANWNKGLSGDFSLLLGNEKRYHILTIQESRCCEPITWSIFFVTVNFKNSKTLILTIGYWLGS